MVAHQHLRIASRGSQLALWQAETIQREINEAFPEIVIEIDVIRTTGDRILDVPLARIGDRGLFTKEIDEALLDGRADLAVHSLKDVPTLLPDGLELAAIGRREDPRDVFIGRSDGPQRIDELPPGARVGTSSLRRRSQLRRLKSDVTVVDLRGNLNTRLAKLDAGEYDGIILAAAGVIRLGWSERISEVLTPDVWLPAVGQGALAIVTRTNEADVASFLLPIHHPPTAACVTAERAFLRSLEGGCQVPIGALATISGDTLELDGFVADLDGATILRDSQSGSPDDSARLGETLGAKLIDRGALEILEAVRRASTPPPIPAP